MCLKTLENLAINSCGLDPAWYYTTPGFAWDCMLKYTKVRLELLTDYDTFFIFVL